jgi:steroid 5-alpha reductase family enzyme
MTMKIESAKSRTLKQAFTLVVCAYLLALLIAAGTGFLFRALHPVLLLFLADIAGTLVIYLFGRIFHNASFYDAYWSIAPLVISMFWLLQNSAVSAATARQIIVLSLVFIWGLRLTYNWARQWRGLKHEDWRYRDLRQKFLKWFWLIDLIGIETMPTIIVFLACLSLYSSIAIGKNPFGFLDVIAILITFSAILIETIADGQLQQFTRSNPQSGNVLTKGLWAYSRHPNYFGEVMFWWGLFIFGLAADSGYWWTIIGPVSITLLFTCISIPLMEKRNTARRPGYAALKKKIPVFLPWFPKS